ncbi:hypothetical protein RAD15_38305 [Bradyrhizobium sp. 14AA]
MRFLLWTPLLLMALPGAIFFGFYRFAFWATAHLGVWNSNAEQLVLDGRTILCTFLAGALGAYLRIAFNLSDLRAIPPAEATFIASVQVLAGGIVGFFLYVVVKSKVLLRILYVGDVSTIVLDWEGAVALSLFAGLAARKSSATSLRAESKRLTRRIEHAKTAPGKSELNGVRPQCCGRLSNSGNLEIAFAIRRASSRER